jgi:UDP-N-acetylmuramate--alanine ligase
MCIDHPVVQGMVARVTERRILTYGFSPQADIRATNIRLVNGGTRFDVIIADRTTGKTRTISDLFLAMYGEHNVQNSLAAIAVAAELKLGDAVVRASLRNFKGVRRRFTKTGEWNGVAIIDDYGHHPVEIAAVLKAARAITAGKVIAVVQPHRYSRLSDLFEGFCTCFNDADIVLVADVYAAGESPVAGIDRAALIAGLAAHGHRHVEALETPAALAPTVRGLAKPGDLVVCLGAGSITNWANALPAELAELDAASRSQVA